MEELNLGGDVSRETEKPKKKKATKKEVKEEVKKDGTITIQFLGYALVDNIDYKKDDTLVIDENHYFVKNYRSAFEIL